MMPSCAADRPEELRARPSPPGPAPRRLRRRRGRLRRRRRGPVQGPARDLATPSRPRWSRPGAQWYGDMAEIMIAAQDDGAMSSRNGVGAEDQAHGLPGTRRACALSSRKLPSIWLATMETPVLCTPRVVMHWCAASIATPRRAGARRGCGGRSACCLFLHPAPRVGFHHARQLGDANDLVGRQVADVGLADDRRHGARGATRR